jgi:cytochrome c oxidase cbb3-type subunit 3
MNGITNRISDSLRDGTALQRLEPSANARAQAHRGGPYRQASLRDWLITLFAVLLFTGCSREERAVGAGLPQTPPGRGDDRRIPFYQENAYQIAQGGRYFAWYGCSSCHGDDAKGHLDLGTGRWIHGSGFDRVYQFIERGHDGHLYEAQIPTEQLWQITAYVRDLPTIEREKRRRQDLDGTGEPQGSVWTGPIK